MCCCATALPRRAGSACRGLRSGQLACSDGRFANVGRRCAERIKMPVSYGFFERNVNVVAVQVNLASGHVGDLADDLAGWPKRGPSGEDRLRLNSFTYDRISGAATDAPWRPKWLSRGDHWNSVFHPQPYQQIGRVPGAMGHAWDRRLVVMARERLQRQGVPGCTLPGWPKR